ncbi:O-antigen ligase family protein [Bacillus infantis]|uniref:O-antigen ligase family protein n=1 Tax=Bacillus infantis TaxID=324767 RepID=UPI001CD6014A|nr:O-antigen ligase family protein [Bacillus infantis]MCA1041611.1 O-antigen ligase family protein [Bacillus infantis]
MKYNRLNISNGLIVFLMIPFFEPAFFGAIPIINSIYYFWSLASMFLIFFIYIFYSKKSGFMSILILFQLIYFLSSIVNHSLYSYFVVSTLHLIALCMMVYISIVHNKAIFILKTIFWILAPQVLIHIITRIISPNGLLLNNRGIPVYFLEADNSVSKTILLFIVVGILYLVMTKKKSILYTTFIYIGVFTIIYSWSATGLGGLIILGISLFFLYLRNMYKVIGIKQLILSWLVIYYLIVIKRAQEIFSFFIVDILHKDLTFHGRTLIWDVAFKAIQDSLGNWKTLLFGYGVRRIPIIYEITGYRLHSHNEILEIILKAGFVGLVVFLVLLFIITHKISKFKNSKITVVISCAIFSFLIMAITDLNFYPEFFVILTFASTINLLIEQSIYRTVSGK